MKYPYWVVDAFATEAFAGNPAAVILADAFPDDGLMQAIAAENNLSETAFVVAAGDAFRLRWFTPSVEVDLCGHATLASAFVMKLLGGAGPFLFDTRSGRLAAELAGDRIVLDFPARHHKAYEAPATLAEALGVTPRAVLRSVDLIAVLDTPEQVRDLRPDIAAIGRLPGGAIIVTAAGGANGADVTSRYFAPRYGIAEDPVTGSLHTQVVPYWAGILGKPALLCHQASARGGVLWCEHHGERVRMAGHARLYAKGEIYV